MRHEQGEVAQPFPLLRPEVTVTDLPLPTPAVDYRGLVGWEIAPELGAAARWANYAYDGALTEVCELYALREAAVHGQQCVEIGVETWEPETGWYGKHDLMFARLSEDSKEWLAILWDRHPRQQRRLATFLDPGFDAAWGRWPRRIADDGWLQPDGDGGWRQAPPEGVEPTYYTGRGAAEVRCGERRFICLRCLGVEDPVGENAVLTEHFLTFAGESVYMRHWRAERPDSPPGERLRLDGRAYVLWYHTLSQRLVGLEGS